MLKIYHVPGTRSTRVIWLCEELGLPLKIEPVSFAAEYRMSPEWLAKNPLGKVPVMEDRDLSMFESGAMVEYILDRYGDGQLQPKRGTPEHALFLQWCWFGEATFARPLGEIVNHGRNFDPPIAEVIAEMRSRASLCVSAINDAVVGKNFLLGDFSAADVMVGYSLMLHQQLVGVHDYADANRYWHELSSRPAFIKASGDLSGGPLGKS